jgi:hypothetical protein
LHALTHAPKRTVTPLAIRTFVFEVKMCAVVEITAASRGEAEKLLDVFVNDPFGAAPSIDGLSATYRVSEFERE